MIEFILTKENVYYYLKCNDNLISEKRFGKDREAIEYFEAFITSWARSKLTVDF